MRFQKVRQDGEAPPDTIRVTLFKCAHGVARGWYIGPLAMVRGNVALPYLPPSELTLASLAVVRAYDVGVGFGLRVFIIDPDDLWDEVWPATQAVRKLSAAKRDYLRRLPTKGGRSLRLR